LNRHHTKINLQTFRKMQSKTQRCFIILKVKIKRGCRPRSNRRPFFRPNLQQRLQISRSNRYSPSFSPGHKNLSIKKKRRYLSSYLRKSSIHLCPKRTKRKQRNPTMKIKASALLSGFKIYIQKSISLVSGSTNNMQNQ
jgi:hypothetical protein